MVRPDHAGRAVRLPSSPLHHRVGDRLATVQAVMNTTLRSPIPAKGDPRPLGQIASPVLTHALVAEDVGEAAPFDDSCRAERVLARSAGARPRGIRRPLRRARSRSRSGLPRTSPRAYSMGYLAAGR